MLNQKRIARNSVCISILMILLFNIITSSSLIVQSKPDSFETETIDNSNRAFSEDENSTSDESSIEFDLEQLFNYLNEQYSDHLFREVSDGYSTSLSTYYGLETLRIFGMDYHKFGSGWEEEEDTIRNSLISILKDSESNGFLLAKQSHNPTVTGSYGVIGSTWLIREYIDGIRSHALGLLDFLINNSYTEIEPSSGGFAEINAEASLRTTFEALRILEILKIVAIENFDSTTVFVNTTVNGFIQNNSEQLISFIEGTWTNNEYFNDSYSSDSLLEQAVYAINALKIINRTVENDIWGSLAISDSNLISWIKSLQKTSGGTSGGFGSSEYATVVESSSALELLHNFQALDQINIISTVNFIYSSQFLQKENISYRLEDFSDFGGFSPNNLTHSEEGINRLVSIKNSYYAAKALLISGDLINSTTLDLTTSHASINTGADKSNLIIQGMLATIDLRFVMYNFRTHGSLEVETFIDDWEFIYDSYLEQDSAFIGKNATYNVQMNENETELFDWSLGNHTVIVNLAIRNQFMMVEPELQINSTVFVSYETLVNLNIAPLKPGDSVNITVLFRNRTMIDREVNNITFGNLSMDITSPDLLKESIYENSEINTTDVTNLVTYHFENTSLLGKYILNIGYSSQHISFTYIFIFELEDTVEFYDYSVSDILYPGSSADLNISLKYTNGDISPNLNASLIFTSNKTLENEFTLNLKYIEDNIYSSRNEIIPTKLLWGYYNITIRLSWNRTAGIISQNIRNTSFPVVTIGGIPAIKNISLKTDYRNNVQVKDNGTTIYYGESINLSFNIAIEAPTVSALIKNESVQLICLILDANGTETIQELSYNQDNESFTIYGRLNSNIPSDSYIMRLKLWSEWNSSFIYFQDPTNSSKPFEIDLNIEGSYSIEEIMFYNEHDESGTPIYALDETLVFSVSFKVNNVIDGLTIPVTDLSLYGELFKSKNEEFQESLPSALISTDRDGNRYYNFSIPLGMKAGQYKIRIFTTLSISTDYQIGDLGDFKVVNTLHPKPLIQIQDLVLFSASILFVGLVYLNIRKIRR